MGRHSRPDGQQHRHQPGHGSSHLVAVPTSNGGRHRASTESSSSSYEGRHYPPSESRIPTYEGRHRASHTDPEPASDWVSQSYHSARRAVVATTVATALTAGGIVGLLWNHLGDAPNRAGAIGSHPHFSVHAGNKYGPKSTLVRGSLYASLTSE